MNPQTQNDPDVVNLAKSIIQTESGGNFNAKGKSGESGAAQWLPATWSKQAGNILGDANAPMTPDNQKAVLYATVKQDKDSGLNPAQIAAKWNSGSSENWQNKIGTNAEGVAYNVPQYVKKVTDLYQQYKGGQAASVGSALSNNSAASPVAQGVDLAQASTGDTDSAPESTLQKAGDVVGSVGNFLFPVAGDIGAVLQGKSTGKTGLQIAGDTAMSVLPFIPGIGEVGEAARGAEAVGEGLNAIKGAGLLGKIAGSTITKGAAAGYGYGSAQNLSQGQSLGQAFMPNINNIGGGVLGGATPIALKGVSAAAKGLSGVSDQVLNALKDSGISTEYYNSYINAAKERAQNVRAPAPLELAANQLDTAAKIIQSKTDVAGQAVGEAKKAASAVPLAPIEDIGKQFQQHVGDKYGLDLRTDPNTGQVHALSQEGNMRQVAPNDVKRIENIATQLNNLFAKNGTVKNATEVMDNLNNLVDHSKADIYGKTNDPLEGLIKDTAGNLNKAVRKSSQTLADANDTFSGLKGLQEEIKTMAGSSLNRGELLMKRVFSGDKSGDVQNLFGKIKDETGIDLVNHAVLAKHAIDVAGDASQKSLLQQMIEGGSAISQGPLATLLHIGQKLGQKTIGNPETIGRNAVKGTEGLLSKVGNYGTKSAIVGSRAIPGILGL